MKKKKPFPNVDFNCRKMYPSVAPNLFWNKEHGKTIRKVLLCNWTNRKCKKNLIYSRSTFEASFFTFNPLHLMLVKEGLLWQKPILICIGPFQVKTFVRFKNHSSYLKPKKARKSSFFSFFKIYFCSLFHSIWSNLSSHLPNILPPFPPIFQTRFFFKR
jgi:hypothetical protein